MEPGDEGRARRLADRAARSRFLGAGTTSLQVALRRPRAGDGRRGGRVPVQATSRPPKGPVLVDHRPRPPVRPARRVARARRATTRRATTTRRAPYTPAWQERYTGIDRATVIRFARELATTAEKTEGKCSVIIGAGVNQWYHSNLDLPRRDHRPRAVRLRGAERRRAQPLRRPGEARAGGALVAGGLRARLGPAAAPAERAQLPLRPLRPVALRGRGRGGGAEPGGRARAARRGPHHGPPGAGGAARVAALLPAVRPEPLRARPRRGAGRRPHRRRGGDLGGRSAQGEDAPLRGGGPRRARQLAAALVHLARQRAPLQRQGARVLPEALPRDPPRQRRARGGEGSGARGRVAGRAGRAGSSTWWWT